MTRENFLYGQTWSPRPTASPVSEPETKAEQYDRDVRYAYELAESDEHDRLS
jgi:hypothetical protein